ncbi:MAG: HepT-like ribonuclease domain-containing protein [Terriglobia bacterium]
MSDATVYLKHIRDAIAKIEAYTQGGRKAFFQSTMVQDSVVRNLEIIGEAVKNLPDEVKKQNPKVPWRSITALRNVLIHEYFGVDLNIVWGVVSKRLPVLKRHVLAILSKGKRLRWKA